MKVVKMPFQSKKKDKGQGGPLNSSVPKDRIAITRKKAYCSEKEVIQVTAKKAI